MCIYFNKISEDAIRYLRKCNKISLKTQKRYKKRLETFHKMYYN